MKITFDSKSAKAPAAVFFATEGAKLSASARAFDKKAKGALKRAAAAEGFTGKKGETLVIPAPAGSSLKHAIVIGLGKASDLTALDIEKAGSQLTTLLNAKKATAATVEFLAEGRAFTAADAVRFAEGALLTAYRFDRFLTKEPKEKKPTLKSLSIVTTDTAAAKKDFAIAQKKAEAVFFSRTLVSEPPNVLYPESFAERIAIELKGTGIEIKVLGMKDLQKLGMGALIAVGQGSVREPKLVTMHYKGGDKNQKPVAFVGKGVTFDTGGISLKPGPGMEEMKYDMAGAAAVVGAMKALAARGAAMNVVGCVALAENMPSGNAYRPGDIITSMSGQTIEVHNTDAEGRLILCDALWYVQETFKPTEIIDLATLTGAVLIALGHEFGGLFANDDTLAKNLVDSGKHVGEHLWRLPLHEAWNKSLDTLQADMKNISGNREAGSAVGAHFLQRFIQKGVKWAHLDIAGMAWTHKDRPSTPKGATGFGVRLLDRYIAAVHEGKA